MRLTNETSQPTTYLVAVEPLLPCSCCGENIPAESPQCPECGEDPRASEIKCDECDGSGRVLSGVSERGQRLPAWDEREVLCSRCCGDGQIETLYFADREREARALFKRQTSSPVVGPGAAPATGSLSEVA